MKPNELTGRLRGDHPLPDIAAGGDTEPRGHVLVVAGCREIPGAAVLAATAALRAGAGIVAESQPAAAYEETRDKAPALIQALERANGGI